MNTVHQHDPELEIQQALQELRGRLSGSLIEPQDPLYEEARAVWNGMVNVHPRAVARTAAGEHVRSGGGTILVLQPEFGMGDEPWMIAGFAWVADDHQAGLKLLEQLRLEAPPDQEEVGATSWVGWQSAMDTVFPKGSRGYWKNVALSRLDQEVIDVLVGFASELTWQGTGIDVHHLEGAFGRVPEWPQRSRTGPRVTGSTSMGSGTTHPRTTG
jgi:hypothetical protein